MADSVTKNLLEKLFVMHAIKLKTGKNLISQREDVGADDSIQESEFPLMMSSPVSDQLTD